MDTESKIAFAAQVTAATDTLLQKVQPSEAALPLQQEENGLELDQKFLTWKRKINTIFSQATRPLPGLHAQATRRDEQIAAAQADQALRIADMRVRRATLDSHFKPDMLKAAFAGVKPPEGTADLLETLQLPELGPALGVATKPIVVECERCHI